VRYGAFDSYARNGELRGLPAFLTGGLSTPLLADWALMPYLSNTASLFYYQPHRLSNSLSGLLETSTGGSHHTAGIWPRYSTSSAFNLFSDLKISTLFFLLPVAYFATAGVQQYRNTTGSEMPVRSVVTLFGA
jgi:hypothetical protein